MKLVNKKKTIYNGEIYYITIKKIKSFLDTVFFSKDYGYTIIIHRNNKKVIKHSIPWYTADNYKGDMDAVIKFAVKELIKKHYSENKYKQSNTAEFYIDNEYKEQLYKQFYEKVIEDLKEKGLINKDLFINKERRY